MEREEKMNFIIIDMSYFIFYRFFALKNWWSFSKKDEPLSENPEQNPEFMAKFEKTFLEKIREIPKKLKIHKEKYEFIMARDCSRKDIWRNDLYDKYKANRESDDAIMMSVFFKRAYEILKDQNYDVLYHNKLEADDCIALVSKNIRNKTCGAKMYIIANDMDYLQLQNEDVILINLKYKLLTENKKWFGDAKKDLFCKIIMGDRSDNIPGVFAKCGIKSAIKCYENKEFFEKKLKDEGRYETYLLNKKLIDFNEIPDLLKDDFHNENQKTINNILLQYNLNTT